MWFFSNWICFLLSIMESFKYTVVYQTLLNFSPSFNLRSYHSCFIFSTIFLLGYFKANLRHNIFKIFQILMRSILKAKLRKEMKLIISYSHTNIKYLLVFRKKIDLIFELPSYFCLYNVYMWYFVLTFSFYFFPLVLLRYSWHIMFYFLMYSLRPRNFFPIFEFSIPFCIM